MKQKKGLIILLIILLALLAVYFGMKSINAKKQEEKEAKEKAEVIQVIKVKNPTEISYSADDGSSIAFEKDGDTWYLKDDKETKLQQTAMQTIEKAVCDIQAERQIKDPDDIASYGLDAPLYTITVTDQKGETYTVYIGDGAGSDYYMTTGNKTEIYTVSSDLINKLEFDKDTLADTSDEKSDTDDSASTTDTSTSAE